MVKYDFVRGKHIEANYNIAPNPLNLPLYTHPMFYSMSEKEVFDEIIYEKLSSNYDPEFEAIRASVKGELPWFYTVMPTPEFSLEKGGQSNIKEEEFATEIDKRLAELEIIEAQKSVQEHEFETKVKKRIEIVDGPHFKELIQPQAVEVEINEKLVFLKRSKKTKIRLG